MLIYHGMSEVEIWHPAGAHTPEKTILYKTNDRYKIAGHSGSPRSTELPTSGDDP
jgi:hypothetical protein